MSDTEYCITQLTVENEYTQDVPLNQYEHIVINNPEKDAIMVG